LGRVSKRFQIYDLRFIPKQHNEHRSQYRCFKIFFFFSFGLNQKRAERQETTRWVVLGKSQVAGKVQDAAKLPTHKAYALPAAASSPHRSIMIILEAWKIPSRRTPTGI